MYDLNTTEGKKARIETLTNLIYKICKGENLELEEKIKVSNYLEDIKQDLKGQLFMEQVEHYRKRTEEQKQKRN